MRNCDQLGEVVESVISSRRSALSLAPPRSHGRIVKALEAVFRTVRFCLCGGWRKPVRLVEITDLTLVE